MALIGTFTSGSVLTAAELNQFNNVCALWNSGTTSIANATETNITFGAGTEIVDVSNWHSTSTNTERITPNVAGIYLVGAGLTLDYAGMTTAQRLYGRIYKNTTGEAEQSVFCADYAGVHMTEIISLNGSTDYVKLMTFQNTGATRNVKQTYLYAILLRTL